jgi:hypothetical protein
MPALSLRVSSRRGGAATTTETAVTVPRAASFEEVRAQLCAALDFSDLAEVTYVDDEGDVITVGSEPEWLEAVRLAAPIGAHDTPLDICCVGIPAARVEAPDAALTTAAAAAVTGAPRAPPQVSELHPDTVGTTPCRAIPRRVASRATILQRHPHYKPTPPPANLPPVLREPSAPVDRAADEWELVEAAPAAPSPSGVISLKVNGTLYTVPTPEPEHKLVDFLRKVCSRDTFMFSGPYPHAKDPLHASEGSDRGVNGRRKQGCQAPRSAAARGAVVRAQCCCTSPTP